MATFETPPTPGTGFPSLPKNLVGTSTNEVFATGSGNDVIDGGAGTDTVTFTGTRAEHTIVKSGTGWTVSSPADGTDTIQNVERIKFSDTSVALDLTASNSAGGIYRLYVALLNREPELGGLGYWIDRADKGLSGESMASEFVYQEEFKNLYGITNLFDHYATGNDLVGMIKAIYKNVFNRDADQGGLDFYVGMITSHERTLERVLAEFADSPEYKDRITLTGVLADGVAYTPWPG